MQWKAGIQLNLRSTQCKAGIRSTQYLEICSGPVCTDIHQCLFQCQIKRGGGLTKQSFSGQCQRNVRETETPCSQTSKDEWNAQGSKSWRAIEHFSSHTTNPYPSVVPSILPMSTYPAIQHHWKVLIKFTSKTRTIKVFCLWGIFAFLTQLPIAAVVGEKLQKRCKGSKSRRKTKQGLWGWSCLQGATWWCARWCCAWWSTRWCAVMVCMVLCKVCYKEVYQVVYKVVCKMVVLCKNQATRPTTCPPKVRGGSAKSGRCYTLHHCVTQSVSHCNTGPMLHTAPLRYTLQPFSGIFTCPVFNK